MLRSLGIRLVPSACAAALVALFAAAPLPPLSGVGPGRVARAAEAIASAETNTAGLVAEIIQCRRIEGVLSIYMRLRNTTDTDIDIARIEYDNFYVTAKNKKYLLMKDKDRNFLASPPAPGSLPMMLATLK
jgi:hypothetical protein